MSDDKKEFSIRHGVIMVDGKGSKLAQICDHSEEERCHLGEFLKEDLRVGETVYEDKSISSNPSVGWSRSFDAGWSRTFGKSDDRMEKN